jgi:hypothetical protein
MPSLNTGNAILSNAIAVDSSYNVGIGGAASGSFKLQVTGTSNLTGALSGTSATFSSDATINGILNNRGSSDNVTEQYYYRDGTYEFGVQKVAGRGTDLFFTGPDTNFNIAQRTTYGTVGGTVRFTVTSGGNVGIGTSSPIAKLDVTVLSSGDRRLLVNFDDSVVTIKSANSASNPENLRIIGDGITFNTGSSGSGTQKMVITNGGVLQMVGAGYVRNALQSSYFGYNGVYRTLIIGSTGTDYQTNSVSLAFNVDVSANANGGFTGDGSEYFWRNVGSFKTPNTANNSYNTLLSWNSAGVVTITTSDYRTKEDLKSFEALPMVQSMKLYDFRWIELQERMHGVIAHELQEIVPYAVIGEKDSESMQGVDYSKLVPIMLKAIQEQQAQIEELSNKIVALELK